MTTRTSAGSPEPRDRLVDNPVYAQLTDIVGPKEVVKTAHALGIKSRARCVLLDRARLRRREPARDGARLRNDRERRQAGRRDADGRQPARGRAGAADSGRASGGEQPAPETALDSDQAAVLTGILEDVVRAGTGRRAGVAGKAVAGKTGTTDNYADAWFVGYTPELVVAVWVGYPDRLRPMLTEYGGKPVTGGTLPALIWKEFVERVDESDDHVVVRARALSRRRIDLGRQARRTVAARQRALPRLPAARLHVGEGRRRPRTARRTR